MKDMKQRLPTPLFTGLNRVVVFKKNIKGLQIKPRGCRPFSINALSCESSGKMGFFCLQHHRHPMGKNQGKRI